MLVSISCICRCHQVSALTLSSIFEICAGRSVPCDLMAIETPKPGHGDERIVTYGMLGVVTGMIADVDVEGERLRCLGGDFRNAIYGVLRIATLRKYKYTLSYLPDGHQDTVTAVAGASASEIGEEPLKNDSRSDNSHAEITHRHTNNSLKNHLLDSFSNPLTNDWKTVHGDFIQVTATNLSHIGQGLLYTAGVEFGDGLIRFVHIRSSATRRNMMKYWGCMEEGVGVHDETESGNVSVLLCKAFRISPEPKRYGNITLDGERLPYGPIQGQIHPELARIFCSPRS